jgi:hypothetical protein
MIRPEILLDPVIELFVVVLSHTQVDYQVVLAELLVEVRGNVVDRISICFLEPGSWESHCHYSAGDVGQVKIELFVYCSVFRSGDYFSEKIYHQKCVYM